MDDKESILNSIKILVGDTPENTSFDLSYIIHINSAFSRLNELGIGPDNFKIEDKTKTWTEYLTGYKNLESIKTYVYLKVKKVFDPPTSSTLLQVLKESIDELESTISMFGESQVITV